MNTHEIRMDRPGLSAIDESFVEWMEGELEAAAGRPILLCGTKRAFSAGFNLKRLLELNGEPLAVFLRRVDGLFRTLYDYPGPMVGLVEGHAIAGGCILLQCCDLRVIAGGETIRIGLTEAALGACFPPCALRVVLARVPRQQRERVVLGGELFPPRRALELGLVDRVESPAEPVARRELERLAGHPARAWSQTKRVLRAPTFRAGAEDERRFVEEELPLWDSPELRARIRATLGAKGPK